MLLKKHPISSIAALSALFIAQGAFAADTLTDALTGGKASANLQYRYEDVRNSVVPAAGTNTNKAQANTVRLRLGYTTDTFNGFGAMVEAEHTMDLGNKKYNSLNPVNATFATIQDPEVTEINQGYLSYSGIANTTVKFGRQRLILDNARFIGNSGWRQNEQTFDAFTLVNKSLPDTTITAGYITNVNRVLGDGVALGNAKMKSPIFNVNYKGFSFAEIAAYYYQLDYQPAAGATTTTTSIDTYGIRLNGNTAMGGNKLLYTVEYAKQKDGSNNVNDFDNRYTLLEGGVDVTDIAVFKLGHEILGNDTSTKVKATGAAAASTGFATPLATLHAFNGWADMFATTTPTTGLKDTYVSANTKLAGIALGAAYHKYKVDNNPGAFSDLGNEWNLVGTYNFDKNYTVGLKYADYKAGGAIAAATGLGNGALANTKKTWLWGAFNF